MKRECAMIVLLRDTTVFCAIVKRNEKILLYLHNVRLAPSHHEEGTSSKKCWLLFVMTLLTHSQDSTLHHPSTTIKIFHSFELNLLVASNPPSLPNSQTSRITLIVSDIICTTPVSIVSLSSQQKPHLRNDHPSTPTRSSTSTRGRSPTLLCLQRLCLWLCS